MTGRKAERSAHSDCEIEITPAAILAGVGEIMFYDREEGGSAEAAVRVFEVMAEEMGFKVSLSAALVADLAVLKRSPFNRHVEPITGKLPKA